MIDKKIAAHTLVWGAVITAALLLASFAHCEDKTCWLPEGCYVPYVTKATEDMVIVYNGRHEAVGASLPDSVSPSGMVCAGNIDEENLCHRSIPEPKRAL